MKYLFIIPVLIISITNSSISNDQILLLNEMNEYARIIIKSYWHYEKSNRVQNSLKIKEEDKLNHKRKIQELYKELDDASDKYIYLYDFNDYNVWIDKFYVFLCIVESFKEPPPSFILALSYDGRFYYLKYFHKNDINILIKDFITINNESDAKRVSIFYLSLINHSHHDRKEIVDSSNYEFYRTIYEKVSKPETFKKPEGYHIIIYAMDKYSEQVERYIFDIDNDNFIQYEVEIIQKGTSENYLRNMKKYRNKE